MSEKNFDEYVDKKVVLVHNLDKPNEKGESAEEIEGTVLAANALGVMLKPKGKTQPVLIDVDKIESVDYAPETAKKLSRKTLKPVEFGQARAHLLERHGYTVSQVNEMSEKQAFETHKGIDHEAADLGHVHGSKEDTERAAAVSDAEDAA